MICANRFIYIACFLLFSIMLKGQNQLSLQQMQADFDQLATAFKEKHQGLYFYTDTLATNRKIDSLRSTLTADLPYRVFFSKIATLVAFTNEGHTNLSYSKPALKAIEQQTGFLPFGIFFCGENKDAIIQSVYEPTLGALVGKKVRSINGMTMEEIMAIILPAVATDGFNTTSAYEWVAWDFPSFYYYLNGLSSSFQLELEDIDGNSSTQNVKALDLKTINKQSTSAEYLLVNGLFPKRTYRVIDDSIAYVAMVVFSGKDKAIKAFYEQIFSDIKSKGIQHLILDIQRHVGGSEGVENLLASYLFREPFQKYRAVTAPFAVYQEFGNSKSIQRDKWRLVDNIPHRGDFTLMSNYYSDHQFDSPNPNLIFDGKVYVLTSGVTFSGGAEFASMLKMQDRALFIGEEVGGAHEGNVSGYSRSIKLEHSGISVSLPIVHFKMNSKPAVKGHGVMPDYEVPQTWKDLLEASIQS